MAAHYSPPVLLGFVDSEIPAKDSSKLNFRVNKIGGNPDWPIPGCEAPICLGCNRRRQVLIIQMYAPVLASPDHRTLYFFACLFPECWKKQDGWTCIRVQQFASPEPEKEENNCASGTAISFFEETEDWASDSEDSDLDDQNNANENLCDNAIFNVTNQNLVPTTSAAINNSQGNEEVCDNLNSNNSNTNACNKDLDTGIMSVQLGELNLNQGSNEKGAVGGRVAAEETEDEAPSAYIEKKTKEDDIVAVDSPEMPKYNIMELFNTPSNHYEFLDSVCPYYISVSEEPPKAAAATDMRNVPISISSGEGCASETAYVEDIPLHGDIHFHKFKKRIEQAPGQILRYCKDTNNGPLLPRPEIMENMKCSQCGSRLTFEAQIMPQLINHLKPKTMGNCEETAVSKQLTKGKNMNKSQQRKLDNQSHKSNTKTTTEEGDSKSTSRNSIPIAGVVEFGTVLLYSCEKSCWDGKPVKEKIVVQEEVL